MAIIGGTCAVLSQTPAITSKHQPAAKSDDRVKAAADKFDMTEREQDLFYVMKRNLIHSKKAKDEQIYDFVKLVAENSPKKLDFKVSLASYQNQFYLIEYFIKFIRV